MGSGVQYFPNVAPPNTVLGRLAQGTGPVEAIPFASLASALGIPTGALSSQFSGQIVPSVAASALTISLKTLTGADPSPATPLYLVFRNSNAGIGDFSIASLIAPTTFAVSSGSTLGTLNGVAFRLWVVAFNDSGTVRLGLINCLSGTNIFPLGQLTIASSTAEGGTGMASSAQTFYTTTAVTAKPYVIIGYLEWQTGLATAGTWSAGPTIVQPFNQCVPLPGAMIQALSSTSGAVATGTTVIPNDDTIPQSTEGDQYLSQAITPRAAANVLRIQSHFGSISSTSQAVNTVALFQDSTANAIVAASLGLSTNQHAIGGGINHELLAGTVSSTTFKIRAGPDAAGTLTVNGVGGARKFGGILNSYLRVQELQA